MPSPNAYEPPTERQLAYAKDLGLSIPGDASKDEVSDLITMRVESDKPAEDRHRAIAEAYEIELPRFIGKKALFDRIHETLKQPGREGDLVAWFTYRVYRELVKGKHDGPIDSPIDPLIHEIAQVVAPDESVVKSIRRYQGRDLIWFGEWTAPDGFVHTGGSNQTIAYKRCSALLRQRLGLTPADATSRQKTSPASAPARSSTKVDAKGCLSVIAVVTIGVVAFSAALSWWIFGA